MFNAESMSLNPIPGDDGEGGRGCFLKENREGKGDTVTLAVSGFHFFQAVIYLLIKCSFSMNFRIVESFYVDCVILLNIPKKGSSSPVFTIKILVVEIFGCH